MSSSVAQMRAFCFNVTIEAEYGEVCVQGSELTLAHHGPRSGNPPPCVVPQEEVRAALRRPCWDCEYYAPWLCETCTGLGSYTPQNIQVGLSHLDLDALGGCMAVLGLKPEAPPSGGQRGRWTFGASTRSVTGSMLIPLRWPSSTPGGRGAKATGSIPSGMDV